MKGQLFGIALAALVGLAFTGTETACSSSSSGRQRERRRGWHQLRERRTTPRASRIRLAASTTCPTGMSTGSCPSSNELGCCSTTAMGSNGQSYTFDSCYYCAGALCDGGLGVDLPDGLQRELHAKWTAGSMSAWRCGSGSSSGVGQQQRQQQCGGDAASD